MSDFAKVIDGILVAIIVVAIVAVLVSKHSGTTNALSSFFNVLSGAINRVVQPVG